MRISSKGRYALAAIVSMAASGNPNECTTVISISEKLGISKIYLEQVFSLLKKGGIVNSVKGAQGGYQLVRMPNRITVLDVLSAVENSLFEATEVTVSKKAPEIETAMKLALFDELDNAVHNILTSVTIYDLVNEVDKHKAEHGLMFYI